MSESLRFVFSKGCLALKGSVINDLAFKWKSRCSGDSFENSVIQKLQRDGDEYHITVISAPEAKELSSTSTISFSTMMTSLVQCLNDSLQNKDQICCLYDLGVGCHKESCYYVVLYAPFLQKTRLKLKLPPTDLHITLGFHGSDIHEVRKGFLSLWLTDSIDILHKIEYILQAKSTPALREHLEYNQLALLASQQGYLFGAYFLAKYQTNTLVACDILEQAVLDDTQCKLLPLSSDIGCGTTIVNYGELVCKALNHFIYSPLLYHRRLRRLYSSIVDIKRYEISYVEMPRNFSFVTENIAGSSLPDTRKSLENLVAVGITDIITVMEAPLVSNYTSNLPLKFHWFEVKDRTPPTLQQMKDMMQVCDAPESKTLVHCLGGVGRTATVLASFLMWSIGVSRQEAKQPLIDNRKTIISQSQDDFLSAWYSICLDHRASISQFQLSEDTSSMLSFKASVHQSSTQKQRAETSLPIVSTSGAKVKKFKFPPLIMCVGYPASGKSTFSEALCCTNPDRFIRVNQDESGRKECEANISKLVKVPDTTVILDRCNLTIEERKEWLSLAHNKKAWVIYFSTPLEECKWRIVRRVGHPTLKSGQGGRIIDTLAGTVEPPNATIEKFDQYFEVHSFDACNELLSRWGCQSEPVSTIPEELGLVKFPRTRHLANLGSATRDDLLITSEDVKNIFLNREILVEEKIDGANMGLSIRDNKICAQNRSHYVTAEYHPQFKHLDKWIYQHSAILWEILQSDRYILYGEWCYAKHSIPYAALSDWFTTFDMFDRLENKFWSRSRLEAHLEGTGISMIPLIAKGTFANIEALKSLVHTQSQYYNGPVEGIVVRVNDTDGEYVKTRGKIVRSDFLSGNTHWSKHGCSPNIIVRKGEYS